MIPIPELLNARKVLCIQPHPDDVDLAVGGTIARLVELGAQITYLTLTDGSLGTCDPGVKPSQLAGIRQREQALAADLLGVDELLWLNHPDGGLRETGNLQREIMQVIRQVRPDVVFTVDPWLPYEAHPDHRAAGLAVCGACLFSSLPGYYPEQLKGEARVWRVPMVALYFTAKPNTYVDVTSHWEHKVQAILAHSSQFTESVWQRFAPLITAKGRGYGAEADCELAEAFKVLTPDHLHVFVEAWEM